MRIDHNTTRALVLGVALALGAAACADTATRAQTSNQLAVAGATSPRGPVQVVADATINTKVKALLAVDDLVAARDINVDTIRGIVQLNGTVNSAAEKARALDLARRVDGVVGVKDNLRTAG